MHNCPEVVHQDIWPNEIKVRMLCGRDHAGSFPQKCMSITDRNYTGSRYDSDLPCDHSITLAVVIGTCPFWQKRNITMSRHPTDVRPLWSSFRHCFRVMFCEQDLLTRTIGAGHTHEHIRKVELRQSILLRQSWGSQAAGNIDADGYVRQEAWNPSKHQWSAPVKQGPLPVYIRFG